MAKTELTKAIERALKYYAPAEIGGIKINKFRGWSTAFEVPAECGTTSGGIIDCVRVNEYFGDIEKSFVCRLYRYKQDGVHFFNCPIGIEEKDLRRECGEKCDGCRHRLVATNGVPKVLITCFEIKITKSDFKSKHGHNFVGNMNFYVMPKELYPQVEDLVPDGVGVILYTKANGVVGLRRKINSCFQEMTDGDQKWMVLSVLKRLKDGGGVVFDSTYNPQLQILDIADDEKEQVW